MIAGLLAGLLALAALLRMANCWPLAEETHRGLEIVKPATCCRFLDAFVFVALFAGYAITDFALGQPRKAKPTVFYIPPPQVGDRCTVLHYAGLEHGVVVAINTTAVNLGFVPHSIDQIAIKTLDGAFIAYDPQSGVLSVNGIGAAYVNALGKVELVTGGDPESQSARRK